MKSVKVSACSFLSLSLLAVACNPLNSTAPSQHSAPVSAQESAASGFKTAAEPIGRTFYTAPAWFTDRGNLAQLASVNESVSLPLAPRWQKVLPRPVMAPAAGGHGNLYVSAGPVLYALDPNQGDTRWSYQADGTNSYPIKNSVAALSEFKGTRKSVFLVDGIGNLHNLDAEGSQRWKLVNDGNETPLMYSPYNSAPTVAAGSVFYAHRAMQNGTSQGSELRAVSSTTGSLLWEQSLGNLGNTTPAYGLGSLFVNNCEVTSQPMRRVLDGGSTAWTFTDPDGSYQALCGSSGMLDLDVEPGQSTRFYFGHRENPPVLRSVSAGSGVQFWQKSLPFSGKLTGFALTQERAEKYLIVAQRDRLYSINPDSGAIRWSFGFAANELAINGGQTPRPIIWGDYVFHVTGSTTLKAFSLSTGQEAWSYQLDGKVFASPIAGGQTLYIGTETGRVYAFSPTSP